MGLYSILARCLAPRKKKELSVSERLKAAPFAFRQLERRRVLDASAAAALLTPLGDMSDTVQAGDSFSSEQQQEDTEVSLQVAEPNTAPSNLFIYLPPQVFEGEPVQIGLAYHDPDENDTHTLEIDWGDGTPVDSITLSIGEQLGPHTYLDDNPTGTPSDMNEVTVTITDSQGESVTAQAMIEVLNVDPEITYMDVLPDSLDENGFVTLQLAFEDVGVEDTHTVEIDWGEGLGIETIELTSGERALTTSHKYLDDNPTGDPSNDYTVSVTVIDDDTGTSDTLTDVVTVNNVAPEITFLNVVPDTIDENDSVSLQLAFDDPGTQDTHTVEINWGDGSGLETIELTSGERSLVTSHTYLDDNPTGDPTNDYKITVTVTDDDTGQSEEASTMVTVNNVVPVVTLDPVSPINENGSATLSGSVSDVGTLDTFTLEIYWDDPLSPNNKQSFTLGNTPLTEVSDDINWDPVSREFSLTHQYLDDNPTGDSSNMYTISVKATDDDTGQSEVATTVVTVNNVAPEITFLNVVPGTINENDGVSLQLAFDDPGTQDTHTVEINWGDGSGLETIELTSGERSLVTSHTYLDDNPTGDPTNDYKITVTVTDDDTGQSEEASTMVTVNNVAPEITFLNAVPGTINENDSVSLQLSFDDPGTQDTHTVEIDWGDGSALETIELTSGERSLVTSHTYLDDNPTGDPTNDYKITVTVTDDDTGQSEEASTTVTVNNVVPVVTLDPISPINENGSATLSGSVSDVGTLDTFTLEITWGDPLSPGNMQSFMLGTTELTEGSDGINWDPVTREFSLTHQYLDDNPTGDSSNMYTISVKATDDDTGQSEVATTVVTVNDVEPTVTIDGEPATSPEGTQINLSSTVVDPGTLDTFTYEWEVTVGGNVVATGSDPTFSFTPADNGTHLVTLKVTDDDTLMGMNSVSIEITNVAPTLDPISDITVNEGEFITLPPAMFSDPGFDLAAAGTEENFTATIDWGDGTTEPVGDITLTEVPGSEGVLTTGTIQATHAFADNGEYMVTVTVTDDDGDSATQTFKVTVNNVEPPLDPIDDVFADEGDFIVFPSVTFSDPGFDLAAAGTEENFTASIDWGDGTTEPPLDITLIEVPGSEGVLTTGTITATHAYADNGEYTVTVMVTDDDGLSTSRTFKVTVANVAPTLTGDDSAPFVLDEGEIFSLSDFGVGLSDPGFTLAAAGTQETFTLDSVDWGDGSDLVVLPASLSVFNVQNGSEGNLTTALFESSEHAYADNGSYMVTLTFSDDDSGTTVATFEVTVNNVRPTLKLTEGVFVINEGETLDLTDQDALNPDDILATFSDPGFNNLALGTQENFSYTIDWGDGTVETSVLPSETISGSQGVLTVGTLLDMHEYVDNDVDSIFTITVTLTDDDGGSDTQSFTIQVNNIPPTLDPLVATDVDTSGQTVLTLTFTDPGTEQKFVQFGDDPFTVFVDWGYMLGDPTMDGFHEEFAYAGDTPNTFVVTHTYTEPPIPASLASDITIRVMVQDDDFANPQVVNNSASNIEVVVISNPGIGDQPVRIDTTPQVPRLSFVHEDTSVTIVQVSTTSDLSASGGDARASSGDAKATTEQILELRVVDSYGDESEGIRLKAKVLKNLPKLFIDLPDNHYVIYLIRQETNSKRLVIEVYLRDGEIINPGDDTDSLRKRPPGEEKIDVKQEESEDVQKGEDESAMLQEIREKLQEELLPDDEIRVVPIDRTSSRDSGSTHLVTMATGLVATRSFGTWARRVDRTLAQADKKKWRQLRQRNRSQRKNR